MDLSVAAVVEFQFVFPANFHLYASGKILDKVELLYCCHCERLNSVKLEALDSFLEKNIL